jgi:membrane protein DedA with SNARE-associated domain
MVLMAALLTRVGPLQTFPILIALVTAFLSAEGAKYFLARREQQALTVRSGPGL